MTTRKPAAGWDRTDVGVCSSSGCVGKAAYWHCASRRMSCDSPACVEAMGVYVAETARVCVKCGAPDPTYADGAGREYCRPCARGGGASAATVDATNVIIVPPAPEPTPGPVGARAEVAAASRAREAKWAGVADWMEHDPESYKVFAAHSDEGWRIATERGAQLATRDAELAALKAHIVGFVESAEPASGADGDLVDRLRGIYVNQGCERRFGTSAINREAANRIAAFKVALDEAAELLRKVEGQLWTRAQMERTAWLTRYAALKGTR